MIVHSDNRRTIFDWASGNFKSAKAVIVHEEIAIGDHFHFKKTEEFLLLQGEFLELQIGTKILYNISAPYKIILPPQTYHRFVCTPGSILLGTATELFDETDEIKL